ncbi:protein TASOR 2 isoform X2 [Hyperolius riggenbachi]|uniref:protein TASOR 2 isoform X2 n=1 Tax=Hyperolius riggenbachi TaxID=752182 RepID=UPI0035A2EBB8
MGAWRLQLNNAELYNVWSGPLYIHQSQVCDIELKSLNTCSIPAQLPSRLEVKEAIQLSELKKVLPENFFEKASFTGHEVCCESVYYSLYPVITSNANECELNKLLQWMKDQVLALIKVLNDQGFLILVAASVLRCNRDLHEKNPFQLYALFLFPHSKLLDRIEQEDCSCKLNNEELSQKITGFIPGLQYAILEARQSYKDIDLYPDALVELHVKQYAHLRKKNARIVSGIHVEKTDTLSQVTALEKGIHDKCDQLAFSRLETYFSSPLNFSVPLIKMSAFLKEDVPVNDAEKLSKNLMVKESVSLESKATFLASKTKSDGSNGNAVFQEIKKQPSRKKSYKKSGKRGSKKSKRKPTQRIPSSSNSTSENQVSSKRPNLRSVDQQQVVSSSRTATKPTTSPSSKSSVRLANAAASRAAAKLTSVPTTKATVKLASVPTSRATVKLASAPYPHRRKRGAEVLTAEFVNEENISSTETEVPSKKVKEQRKVKKTKKKSKAEPSPALDRSAKGKTSDAGNKNKSSQANSKQEMKTPIMKYKEQTRRQYKDAAERNKNASFEDSGSFSKSSADLNLDAKQSSHPAPVPDNTIMEKRISMYESHALNLLADLALNSFGSSSIPYINNEGTVPESESEVPEKVHEDDGASTVEQSQKDCSLPLQSSTEPGEASDSEKEPSKNDFSLGNVTTPIFEKPPSYKVLAAAAKAKARNNATSKICLEHSYSQLPLDDTCDKVLKELYEKSVLSVTEPSVTSPNSKELEQSPDDSPGELVLVDSDDASPAKTTEPRAVLKFQDNFHITFRWGGKYDFDLDSKFTTDPLEKTINRALHGPWNPHLKEKVEDVKIILHMWLALFYSKQSQPVSCSSRKVVEHSNPAKYVSINTVLDPFYEIVDSDTLMSPADTNSSSVPMMNRYEISSKMSPDSSALDEVEKDPSSSPAEDLSLASSVRRKDYNIKLASEMFQMYNKSSVSALYTNSLQTTLMCKMTPTSKIPPPPTNYMNLVPANIPTVCYIGDSKQFNTELTSKSEKSVDIGDSSEKVSYREIEHKYFKYFSGAEEVQESDGSEKQFPMLHDDARSTVSENYDYAEISDSAVSPRYTSDTRVPLNAEEKPQAAAELELQEHRHVTCKTVDYAELSPSDALTMSPSAEPSDQNDVHSEHSEPTENQSSSVSFMDSTQHGQAYSTCESGIQTAESRDLQEFKLKEKHEDLAVHKPEYANPDIETSNVHLVVTNTNEANIRKESPHHIDNAESSFYVEYQEHFKSQSTDGLPQSTNLDNSCNKTPTTDEKAAEADKGLNEENHLTVEISKADSILSESVESGKSSREDEEQPMSNVEDCEKENESCTSTGLQDIKESSTDINLVLDGYKVFEAHSSIHEDMLCERPEKSDGLEACTDTVLVKSVLSEVADVQTDSSAGSQEDEPSCIGKTDASVSMGKLELSPSSSEISDVENRDVVIDSSCMQYEEQINVASAGPETQEDMDPKPSDGSEETDVANTSAEQHMSMLNQVIMYVEDNSTDDLQVTQQSFEMVGVKMKEDTVPGHIQTPDLAAPLDVQVESTEAMDGNYPHANDSEENLPKMFDGTSSPYYNLIVIGQDLIAENTQEVTEVCLGEESSLTGSDSSGIADLSVFERLNPEVVSMTYAKNNSPPIDKDGMQIPDHSKESVAADEKALENNTPMESKTVQTDRSSFSVVNTEDHTFKTETDNNCKMVVLISDALQRCREDSPKTATVGYCESSKSTQGSCDLPGEEYAEVSTEQIPVEPETESVLKTISSSPDQPEKMSKDQAHNIRNTIRKEILSKLKRICQSSGLSQPTSSNSEDEVFVVHEEPGRCSSENHNLEDTVAKTEGLSEPELDASIATESKAQEHDTPINKLSDEENMVQEGPVSNASVTPATLETYEEVDQLASTEQFLPPPPDEFSDNMEHEPVQDQSDICFILNTGSISKEQYDRWSDSSDDDIEFVRSYKEPLINVDYHKVSYGFPSSHNEEPIVHPEQSHASKKKHLKRHTGPSTSIREAHEYASRPHRDYCRDYSYSSHKNHGNIIVTRNIKDTSRTISRYSAHKESAFAGRFDLGSIFTNRKIVSDDPTQNTLDMERLRFMCRLKEVLKRSSMDIQAFDSPFQTMFESNRIPGCAGTVPKNRSPLLITVHCPYRRRDYESHDSWYPGNSVSQGRYEDEEWDTRPFCSRTSKKARTHRRSPYHFSRLTYENTMVKPNCDISVILKECAQSNHLKLSRIGLGGTALERPSAHPETDRSGWQTRQAFDPTSSKSQTVGNIISDLCTNLQSRLHSVAKDAAQKNCYFYLTRTIDEDKEGEDDFFSLTKSVLIKHGYTPTEPQDFCDSEQATSNKLFVLIKNEHVFSHIHKIPCLLQLKLLPYVTFSGVDTPEDVPESMYQELFQAGGFVVSEKSLLENITIGKLKEVLAILETMNRTSAWKWLVHYGENRKLKEDKRAESVSQVKIPLLKSYQQLNIIEILPYHRCDSKSEELYSDLECLLSLQSQHIRSRLAVYLTAVASTDTEVFEQNGILVYDVDTFIKRIQRVDEILQSSSWS